MAAESESENVFPRTYACIAKYIEGRRDRGKIGTLRIKAHNFHIINVKKNWPLEFIRVNSLLNNSILIYPFFFIEERIQKKNDLKYDPFLRFYPMVWLKPVPY